MSAIKPRQSFKFQVCKSKVKHVFFIINKTLTESSQQTSEKDCKISEMACFVVINLDITDGIIRHLSYCGTAIICKKWMFEESLQSRLLVQNSFSKNTGNTNRNYFSRETRNCTAVICRKYILEEALEYSPVYIKQFIYIVHTHTMNV